MDDLPQRFVALARLVDLQRAELNAFLIDLGGLDRTEADTRAADIDPVRAAGGERHDLAVVKARRVDHDIVEMLAADLAVIHDHDVARRETVKSVARDAVLHGDAEIGEKDRQAALVLRDHAAFAVDQATAEIAHLVDHHVVGRLAQRGRHLVRISVDGVTHDLDGDRIDFHDLELPALR